MSHPSGIRPVFYLHVRCCGGWAISTAFRHAVPACYQFPAGGPCQMTPDMWTKFSDYPYIGGNFWYYQVRELNLPHKLIVVLREPVEHQLAVYRDAERRVASGQDLGVARNHAVALGLENAVESGEIVCTMSPSLAHLSDFQHASSSEHLRTALENMKNFCVGFFDELETFVPKALHCAGLVKTTATFERRPPHVVDPYICAKMKSYLEPDIELWERAQVLR